MKIRIINALDSLSWRKNLINLKNLDVCYLPEYHLAYSTRLEQSQAILWVSEHEDKKFIYPFLKAPINLAGLKKNFYYDISSVYGYSGPVSNARDKNFLEQSWKEFDSWAKDQKIVCEFLRFSFINNSHLLAHPNSEISFNRMSAYSDLSDDQNEFLNKLGPKTRNMIKKARKFNLVTKEVEFERYLDNFISLYEENMMKNNADDFFFYNQDYYKNLLKLDYSNRRLFAVFMEEEPIAYAMILEFGNNALYHLGTSKEQFNNLGVSNLYLFEISMLLKKEGKNIFILGGGRTENRDDNLLKFKEKNSNNLAEFFIGKRIIDMTAYEKIKLVWKKENSKNKDTQKLQFYRQK